MQDPRYAALCAFADLLRRRDPRAIATIRRLLHGHFHGDAKATALLKAISVVERRTSPAARTTAAAGASYVGAHPLKGLAHIFGNVFGTAGSLLDGTGKLAAKPFRFAAQKLGGHAMHMPSHVHMPHLAHR